MDELAREMEVQRRTWKWLAGRLGVRREVLWRWVSGRDPWPANRAKEVSTILNRPMDELFSDNGDE